VELGAAPTTRNWKFLNLPEESTAMEGITGVTAGDMLSNGTMEYYEAAEQKGGPVEIVGIMFKEHHENATPDLQKCACRAYFFEKCSVGTPSGSAFAFTTELLSDLMAHIDIEATDWVDLEGGKDAYVRKALEKPIKLDCDIKVVQSIIVAKATATYTADHTLIPQLIVAE